MNDLTGNIITELREKLESIKASAEGKDNADETLMKELDWLNYELFNKVSCILLASVDSDTDFSKIATIQERIDFLGSVLDKLAELSADQRTELKSDDLSAVVAKQTGIPLGKVQTKERDRLLGAEGTEEVLLRKGSKFILPYAAVSVTALDESGAAIGPASFKVEDGCTHLVSSKGAFSYRVVKPDSWREPSVDTVADGYLKPQDFRLPPEPEADNAMSLPFVRTAGQAQYLNALRCLGRLERDSGTVKYEQLSCRTLDRKIFVFFYYTDAKCFSRTSESIDELLSVLLGLVCRKREFRDLAVLESDEDIFSCIRSAGFDDTLVCFDLTDVVDIVSDV